MGTEEEKKIEPPFRFRPMVAVAAACFFGALLAYLQYILETGWIFTVVFAVLAIVVCAAFRKKKWILVAAVLAVTVNALAAYAFLRNTPEPFSSDAEVFGTVVSVEGGDPTRVTLNRLTFNGIPADGKLAVTLDTEQSVREGDRVGFRGKTTPTDGTKSSYELSFVAKGILYTAEADGFLSKERGEPNFFGKIRLRVKESLKNVMPNDDAGIAASLLLGDKEYLSPTDYDYVKASGTAHIFAVSGLHVGFLVAAVLWILKKAKANRFVIFIAVTAVLAVYGFLCGFPASFNRAAVMSLTMLFAALTMRRFDSPSALALAAIVILLCDPLSVFTAGFQMSFAAVFGIVLLYRPLKGIVKRGLRFDAISASVALSLSSTLGIYPVTAAYFGTFSTYFIFSNLIIVPLVGVTYLLMLAAVIPAVVAPNVFSVLYYPAYGFVRALAGITTFFGALPASLIAAPPLGLGAIGYYAALAFGSRYCVFRRKNKWIAVAACALFAIALFALTLALKIEPT